MYSSYRAKLYLSRDLSCAEALSASEAILNRLMTRHDLGLLVHVSILAEKCGIHGLYEAVDQEKKHYRIVRRITGGPLFKTQRNTAYISIALRESSLRNLIEKARLLATCLLGTSRARSYGGVVYYGDSKAMYAGTILANSYGLIEIGTYPSENALKYMPRCLSVVFGLKGYVEEEGIDKKYLSMFIGRYVSRSWNLGNVVRYSSRIECGNPNGFSIEIGVDIEEGFIAGWSLNSNMYSAPPMEIYSILSSVKGMPFHELTLFNIEEAVRRRIVFEGIDFETFRCSLRSLYERYGVRYFTSR